MLYSCTYMATVGVKGLALSYRWQRVIRTVARVLVADTARRRLTTDIVLMTKTRAISHCIVDSSTRSRRVDTHTGTGHGVDVGRHYLPGVPVGAFDLM